MRGFIRSTPMNVTVVLVVSMAVILSVLSAFIWFVLTLLNNLCVQ